MKPGQISELKSYHRDLTKLRATLRLASGTVNTRPLTLPDLAGMENVVKILESEINDLKHIILVLKGTGIITE